MAVVLLLFILPPLWAQEDGRLFPVRVEESWGYMDSDGEVVIDPIYEEAYGYIDRSGALVIDPEYVLAQRFSGGVAPVAIIDRDNWAYIDTEGEPISRERWAFAEPFRGGLARVAEEAVTPEGNGFRRDQLDQLLSSISITAQ